MAGQRYERRIADQVVYEGDTVSEDMEITEEVLRTYCESIGLDYDNEPELRWIALEGIKAPLPPPWKPCRDVSSTEIYYFNFSTGHSQWEHPMDEKYGQRVVEERQKLEESRKSKPSDERSSKSPKDDPKRFLKGNHNSEPLRSSLPADTANSLGRAVMEVPVSSPHRGTSPAQQVDEDDDDYSNDVDFGADQQELAERILSLESDAVEPELMALASSTLDRDFTLTQPVSDGRDFVQGIRPQNPLITSLDTTASASFGHPTAVEPKDIADFEAEKKRELADLKKRITSEIENAELEMLEEKDERLRKIRREIDSSFESEAKNLRKNSELHLNSLKEELAAEETKLRADFTKQMEKAREKVEKEVRDLTQNQESEVSKRLKDAMSTISAELDRRLSKEQARLEAEHSVKLSKMREEAAIKRERELGELRSELDNALTREAETEVSNVRDAERRLSAIKVLDTEMSIILDRRRAELREEHSATLASLRRDLDEQLETIRQESEQQIAAARTDANHRVESTRRRLADETAKRIDEVKLESDRLTARLAQKEDSLKEREDRLMQKQRTLDQLQVELEQREADLGKRRQQRRDFLSPSPLSEARRQDEDNASTSSASAKLKKKTREKGAEYSISERSSRLGEAVAAASDDDEDDETEKKRSKRYLLDLLAWRPSGDSSANQTHARMDNGIDAEINELRDRLLKRRALLNRSVMGLEIPDDTMLNVEPLLSAATPTARKYIDVVPSYYSTAGSTSVFAPLNKVEDHLASRWYHLLRGEAMLFLTKPSQTWPTVTSSGFMSPRQRLQLYSAHNTVLSSLPQAPPQPQRLDLTTIGAAATTRTSSPLHMRLEQLRTAVRVGRN